MGIIKEPIEVDFIVESRPLTKAESLALSEFIKNDKAKRAKKKGDTVLQQIEKRLKDVKLMRQGKKRGITVKEMLAEV